MISAKKYKKTPAVIAAEAARDAKEKELAVSRERVQTLEREYSETLKSVTQAKIEADSALPQCRIVQISYRSSEKTTSSQSVILRRTPGGILVVRCVGNVSGTEYRFKWNDYTGKFHEAGKVRGFNCFRRELQDVPEEYIPKPNET